MGYVPPDTGDVTTALATPTTTVLVGTANTESIIRANTLDQMGAPAANLSMNSKRLINNAAGILATDSADLGQLAGVQYPYVVSGCVWTADAPASTRNASMTSGTVMIKGILLTVAAITAHTFTASSDTYVDLTDNGDGTAAVTFVTVANNTISPALTAATLTTIRNAIVITTASAITSTGASINQGNPPFLGPATAQGSTTVAAGSNGSTIVTTPLNVAASTSFPSGGGFANVATNHGNAIIQFTGTGSGTLTGVTVLASQSSAITVATGNSVTGLTPLGLVDMIGNVINATSPYPRSIGYAQFSNSYTTTETTATPIVLSGGGNAGQLMAAFVVPAGGASRVIKLTANVPFLASSAAAGNTVTFSLFTGNLTNGIASAQGKMSVASDGWPVQCSGLTSLAPGTYYATASTAAGSAGTTTVSATYLITSMWVELMS
jgi:hypothetical protein